MMRLDVPGNYPTANARLRTCGTTLLVLAAQLAVAFVIYRPTLRMAFLSDDWAYLAYLQQGFWSAATKAIGYHFQPLAVVWIALIRAVFGENPAAFQAMNVTQVAVLGFLTYQLGLRWLGAPGAAFLGSLLVISNNAFSEALRLAARGQLPSAVGAALRAGGHRRGRRRPGQMGRAGTVVARMLDPCRRVHTPGNDHRSRSLPPDRFLRP